jgi:hypothetical protein
MQPIAKQFIANQREEAKVTVAHPFKFHTFAAPLHGGAVNTGFLPKPLNRISDVDQQRRVGERGFSDGFLAGMKDVDVLGKARAVAIERRRARDIAFGVPVRREQPKNFALEVRERHDTPPRSG